MISTFNIILTQLILFQFPEQLSITKRDRYFCRAKTYLESTLCPRLTLTIYYDVQSHIFQVRFTFNHLASIVIFIQLWSKIALKFDPFEFFSKC